MHRVEMLRKMGVSAALYESRVNIRYLTGYTGEGNLLVLPDKCVIITDFRYIEQAQRQSPACEIARTGNGVTREEIVKNQLAQANLRELSIEANVITLGQYRALEAALAGVTLTSVPAACEELREVKDEGEIACIQKAAAISCAAFHDLLPRLRPGQTEKQACAELDYLMRVHGSEGNAFDTIVASGVNGSLPHAVPSDKPLQKGELITFDFGATSGGYCADMTRTIAMGEVSSELREIYEAVLRAQLMALDAVKPGAACKAIDKIARDALEARYPGAFGHSLGHGVGLFIHEEPGLSTRCEKILKKGHVVTIEPGVYIPGVGGCRIEDMAILTQDGFINPITTPKQLTVV